MRNVHKSVTQTILKDLEHKIELVGDPPDPDDCEVDPGDTITWTNNTKKDWTIRFRTQNPMGANNFRVSANGGTCSVGVRGDAKRGTYPYWIGHSRSGEQNGTHKKVAITIEVDPNVIVR